VAGKLIYLRLKLTTLANIGADNVNYYIHASYIFLIIAHVWPFLLFLLHHIGHTSVYGINIHNIWLYTYTLHQPSV
jgi:hypothetical protein